MIKAKFDLGGANGVLDGLQQRVNAAVRPAAQAGAQVFVDEAKARAPVSEPHIGRGGKEYPGGTLKAAIYQVYSVSHSDAKHATYHVSWNAKKAPHGHFIEHGHWQTHQAIKTSSGRWISGAKLEQPRWIPARPFIRPAYDAKLQAAINAANAEFARRMNGVGE
jgi:hypothetical protein